MNQLRIIVLNGEFALCRLNADDKIPSWVLPSSFYNISKTTDELSVVCESNYVPENIKCDKGWQILKIADVLDLSLTGITAKFSTALADAGVNLCVIATYDTDYIMVKEEKLETAKSALINAGFIIE
jgi:uncharacterized protein